MNQLRGIRTLVLVAAALWCGVGCDKDAGSGGSNASSRTAGSAGSSDSAATAGAGSSAGASLTGAGATFPKPLYDKWASDYSKVRPNVRINYQGIGSGGGIKQITERTVDFGATDGPMTDEQLKKAPSEILHIPMTMGAVVPIYNLPQVQKPLVFSGPVLADMFTGKITRWNDPKLVQLNPDAGLPDQPVTIVHRSDGSGTTFIWTDYLAKVSKEW